MAIKIRPYKLGSRGARLFREALQNLIGHKVWMTRNNRYLRRHNVINWGSNSEIEGMRIVNLPYAILHAVNKGTFFREVPADIVPEWTTNKEAAKEWARQGHKVYCRTLLSSSEGRGIVVAETPEQVVNAPLYTKRFKHAREYRVHVAFGKVIQVVQKKKRNGVENANPLIRSNRGWVFARNLDQPEDSVEVTKVKEVAIRAINSLGLDFGALDILYSKRQEKAVVLECNTAPGLDKTTASIYARAIAQEVRVNG